jgi:hypothetical protein
MKVLRAVEILVVVIAFESTGIDRAIAQDKVRL